MIAEVQTSSEAAQVGGPPCTFRAEQLHAASGCPLPGSWHGDHIIQDTVESGLAIDSTNSAKSNSVQSEHILQRES